MKNIWILATPTTQNCLFIAAIAEATSVAVKHTKIVINFYTCPKFEGTLRQGGQWGHSTFQWIFFVAYRHLAKKGKILS